MIDLELNIMILVLILVKNVNIQGIGWWIVGKNLVKIS